jgi:BirA family biotin operon repressor/biotin-[acetyl-CoA-carboxylase] ligase
VGSRTRSRGRNDPEGNRRPEGEAREGPQIVSLGTRLRDAGSTWAGAVVIFEETDSTNVLAASLAARDAPHGTVVVAKSQSAGKGRWGRRWESTEGGLYLSIVVRPGPQSPLGILPLTTAVAVAEALGASFGIACELRWPNDLYHGGRKLGGILCETSFAGDRCEFAIVGIGVNVNQRPEEFTKEVSQRAISLSTILGRSLDPLEVALAIVPVLEKWWERESVPSVLHRWRELAGPIEGLRVQVTLREGSPYLASIAGLADDGGLEVRLEDGSSRVLRSDEVRLSPEPGYYQEVESHFVARRGSPLFISPSEWDLVWRWEQLGIPLEVVKEGIDRVFERPRTALKPRRLSYCRQTVEAAFRRFREAGLGGRGKAAEEGDSGAAARIEEIAARLAELGPERAGLSPLGERTAAALRSLAARADETPDAIERELGALDGTLLAEAEKVLDEAERSELRRGAESSLESYRERMPEKVYHAALESAYRRRIRRKLGLPTLSLYA